MPRRRLDPLPDPEAPVQLPEALDALLAARHAERMRRAELKSLVPIYLNEIKDQLAAGRTVEENLARGRVRIRREIRRATDSARMGLDRHNVDFPPVGCVTCKIFGPELWGLGIVASPFAVYFGLALIVLI